MILDDMDAHLTGDEILAEKIIELVEAETDCFACATMTVVAALAKMVCERAVAEEASYDQLDEYNDDVAHNYRALTESRYTRRDCVNVLPA